MSPGISLLWDRGALGDNEHPGRSCAAQRFRCNQVFREKIDGQIHGSRAPVRGDADRFFNEERHARERIGLRGHFAVRPRERDLRFLLEGARAGLPAVAGAADEDHGPAVLARVGEPGERVDEARAGHDEAEARRAGDVSDGAGRVGRGLLVAHTIIMNAHVLQGAAEFNDGHAHDPKGVADTLLIEGARPDGRAGTRSRGRHISLACVTASVVSQLCFRVTWLVPA